MTHQISCIIIDDELEVRKRLTSLLKQYKEIKILASIDNADLAVERTLGLKPDIVFIDIEMPGINGINIAKQIRDKCLYPSFIFVTAWPQYAIKAIKINAFDYLLKPIDIVELTDTINRYKKERLLCCTNQRLNTPLVSELTAREKEVLEFAMEGYTSQETANKLIINKTTVDSHRKNILEKTNSKKISDLLIKLLKTQP